MQKPATVNLYEVLEKIFKNDTNKEPDLQPLREILLSLIEHGGRHSYHGEHAPVLGKHQCARQAKATKDRPCLIYCRYL